MALTNVNIHALAVAPQAIMTRVQKGVPRLASGGAKSNLRSVASSIAGFTFPAPGSVMPGGRNQFLARAAGYLSHKARTPSDLPEILGLVNQMYCNPPVDAAEVESVAKSIGGYMPSVRVELGEFIFSSGGSCAKKTAQLLLRRLAVVLFAHDVCSCLLHAFTRGLRRCGKTLWRGPHVNEELKC